MLKQVKRLTSGYFDGSFEVRSDLNKLRKVKSLTMRLKKNNGRDDTGRISSRHLGGGAKKIYRVISDLSDIKTPSKVIDIQYDPNRSANIALLETEDGRKRYIISPEKLKIGSVISYKEEENLKTGDRAMLKNIPVGSSVHDIEILPYSKGKFARSAGTFATLMAIEEGYALLKMPSGELREVHEKCLASLGQVSAIDHGNVRIGKAGRMRHMGKRPTVRGKAMHPAAHPHGGGEGVNPIGLKYPKTPWGKIAIGKKTRAKKLSDKYIISRRKKKG